jgi:hypothetical protein
MANIKDFIKKIGNESVSFEEQQQALAQVEKTLVDAKAKREESIGKNVDLVISALKTIESKLEAKLAELNNTPAKQGVQGPVGKDGKDGQNGTDGRDGVSGKDGLDGKDGVDGQNGVSVTDAKIDFDGSLVVFLSNGNEIDCGQILSPDVAQNIIINSGGSGTSQSVTDTLASLQSQINAIGGGSGTVTSVAATVPSVLSITGSPITSSGTLAIGYSGTALPIANGGTGATVANGAMANLMGFTTTATAAGTTTLTNTSSYFQLFTGSTTQTIVLPVTSTLQTGWTFHICNNSTGTLTINSSGGSLVILLGSGLTLMCTCIGTALTTAADWESGFTDFSSSTGSGAVVLATSPTLSGITVTGTLGFNGTTNISANFATSQTTGNTLITSSQTSGTLIIGGTSGTGIQTIGRSTVSQTTNIQAGATASGSTKTMNIGTEGLSGSTTNIAIGSTTGTSTTTFNGITKNQTYLVANLPSASTSGAGASAFVTNALSPTFGATVVTGGAVAVPVYSDGTNWKVG